MSNVEDKDINFPDYVSGGAQSKTETDRTVIKRKVVGNANNSQNTQQLQQNAESTVVPDDRTVIRNNPVPKIDSTVQRPVSNRQNTIQRTSTNNKQDVTQVRRQSRHSQTSTSQAAASRKTEDIGTPRAKHGSATQGNGQHRILKNRFLLEKVLGVGGMGVVYKAVDRLKVEAKDRDPYVAIKVLSDEFKTHPDAFISLQRESRKAQRLAQPNIVKVYDFDRDGDVVFMTMEYMEGKPLDQLIKQYSATGLPFEDCLEIVKGLCSALSHAHAENIIHSDFKPGNIFVTNTGMAKIFDFGIARAVTNVDRKDGKAVDKTVFDAGSLGALTPAYASMEMLQGQEPDIRDDIYALGCIVYEILTGAHPFNKIPADEACAKGLKPKKITSINKRQWRAIEKSLSFDRDNRLVSSDDFYQQFTGKFKPGILAVASVLLVTVLTTAVYVVNNGSGVSEHDIRNEMEYKIRYDLYQEEIKRLLATPSFSIDWEENLWRELTGVSEMLPKDDQWLLLIRRDIFILYIEKIREMRSDGKLARARLLITNAARYTEDDSVLEQEKAKLALAFEIMEKNKRKYAENVRQKKISKLREIEEDREKYSSFNEALKNVNKQLYCQSTLSMRNFDVAISKLRSLDLKKYQKIEKGIIKSLSTCIATIGERFPERAGEFKNYALRIFPGDEVVAAIAIKPKDACDESVAGLGKYGKRGVCRDKIRGFGDGPDLVVVPRGKNIDSFAIGKYEVTIGEINRFCKKSGKCNQIKGKNSNYPVTGISIKTAKEYTRWLSRASGRKYRLPTKQEWVYASNSSNRKHDPNRNCQLHSRGIQKGENLVNTTTGRQNAWGLVNYLGNAQEWVFDKGGKLMAVGGSYRDAMDKCHVSASMIHTGAPDKVTGFRIIRELKN